MNVDVLKKVIESQGSTPEDKQTALTELRAKAQGAASGMECKAAREALAYLGQRQEHPKTIPLLPELLDKAGVSDLVDVPEETMTDFRRAHSFSGDVEALADKHNAVLRLKFWREYLGETDPEEKAHKDRLIDLLYDTGSEVGRLTVAEREMRNLKKELSE